MGNLKRCSHRGMINQSTYCLMFIFALMMILQSSFAQAMPVLRLCTGSPQGHYFAVGKMISTAISRDIDLKVEETRGSWENLGRVHGSPTQCDAIIAQDDAVAVYLYEHPEKVGEIERIMPLYPEHVQVVCNQEVTAQSLSMLHPDTRMLVGTYGTGTFITWSLIKRLAPDRYGVFRELELGGQKGIDHMLNTHRPQCLLLVQALAQGIMAQVNDELGNRFKLIRIDDPSFQIPINQGGTPRVLFQTVEIHKSVYPRLLTQHLPTQTVDAVFYLRNDWRQMYPREAEHLRSLLIKMQSRIRRSID